MCNIKNIKINDKQIELDISNGSKPSYSGTVYELDAESDKLAIKIYRSSPRDKYEIKNSWFPTEEDLERFIEVSNSTYPILLSHDKVMDQDDKYIGCSTYYVTETKGNTKELIYEMPFTELFESIYSLKEQIPIISKAKIMLDDWRLDNIKYGTISKFPNIERFYSFDDSCYSIGNSDYEHILNCNYRCFDGLANDLAHYFYNQKDMDDIYFYGFRLLLKGKLNTFEYIEETSRGYENLGEYLIEYPKVINKNKF